MNSKFSLALLFVGLLQPASAQSGLTTIVSGHVRLKNGKPAANALVQIYYGATAGIASETHTDGEGVFKLTASSVGLVDLSASKIEDGYPDAMWAFYKRDEYKSTRNIALKGEPITDVELAFGTPEPVWSVLVKGSGGTLKNARIDINLTENARVRVSFPIDASGRFTFVLPRRQVHVLISASGYRSREVYLPMPGKPLVERGEGGGPQTVILEKNK